jgi:signal transduction histidine kinase
MNAEAIIASIAHEVRQPLSAITTNAAAALRFLGRTPPDFEEMRAALGMSGRRKSACTRLSHLRHSTRTR